MEGETQTPVVAEPVPVPVPAEEVVAPAVPMEEPVAPPHSPIPAVDVPMAPAAEVAASEPVAVAADAPAPVVAPPADAAAAPPAVEEKAKPRPKRITRALLKRHVRKGKLLENQLFTWRSCEVPEGGDEGDFVFYGCKMKIDLKKPDGEIAVPVGKMVKRVEWYTSHSIAAFYPSNFDSSAILMPLTLQITAPIPLL